MTDTCYKSFGLRERCFDTASFVLFVPIYLYKIQDKVGRTTLVITNEINKPSMLRKKKKMTGTESSMPRKEKKTAYNY